MLWIVDRPSTMAKHSDWVSTLKFFFKSAKVMKMSFNNPSVRRSRAYGGSHLSSFPQYQSLAETYGCSVVHKSYMSDSFARCSGLYHHDLLGHFGCVNAIEFSSNGGEFIVSGAHFVLLIFDFVLCFGPLIRGSPTLSWLFVSLGELHVKLCFRVSFRNFFLV